MVVTHGASVCAPPCVQFMNFLYLPHPFEYGSNLNRIVFYPWNQAWNEVSHLFERMFSLHVEIYRRQRERERGGERENQERRKRKRRGRRQRISDIIIEIEFFEQVENVLEM